MAYASPIHVLAYCPARATFTATSTPRATQVGQFLEDAAAVLDGIVAGRGYSVPVATGATVALSILRRANAIGAWAEVEAAAPSNKSGEEDRAMKQWADAQEQLRSGELQLPDAPHNSAQAFARAGFAATAWFSREMQL